MYINNYNQTSDTDTYYTKGEEFFLDGRNYIGEYHYKSGKPYTGPYESTSPKQLIPHYKDRMKYTYDSLFNFKKAESTLHQPARTSIIVPTESDYQVGSYMRYFMQSIIDKTKIPIELSKAEFQNIGKAGGLDDRVNAAFSFVWFLTGPLGSYKDAYGHVIEGLYEKNEKTIKQTSLLYPNIIYTVKNYTEFARPSFV
jgi:hypothetical protein